MTLEAWHERAVHLDQKILDLKTQLQALLRERDALFTAAVTSSGEAIDIAWVNEQKLPARRRTA